MVLRIRDANGNIQEVLALKGEKGDPYVLTEADKQEIAATVKDMIENGDEVRY